MTAARWQVRVSLSRVVCVVCLLTACAGCSTTPYSPGLAVDDEETRNALRQSMATQYPDQFRSVQRAVLTVRKRQFNLDGYLRVDRSEGFRFLATSGFGTTMFDLAGKEDGTVEVIQNGGILSDDVLVNGPAKDILALYFRRPSRSAQLTAPTPDTWALVDTYPGKEFEEYRFDRSTGRLMMVLRAKRGRVQYLVEYGGVAAETFLRYPKRIRLSDTQMGYKVDIRVIELTPDEFDPKILSESSEHD